MSAKVQSLVTAGVHGLIIDIECHLSNSLPNIVIVGFANKAVDEAKERLRGAFANSHLQLPRKRITINLAPADLPKNDSGFDLAIAAAILLASGQVNSTFKNDQAVLGELGLDGTVRPVRGIIGKLLAGRNKGITTFIIPAANLGQAKLVPDITLLPFQNLLEFYHHLSGAAQVKALKTKSDAYTESTSRRRRAYDYSLDDIAGQEHAKRALEIAAAGGHNVFFSGPPGTGKSMLAKTLISILPDLNHEEMLEVTHLHSLANSDYDAIIQDRPFRSPHHSASHVAIIGGGHNLRPGEISLSHRGVLLFDELPEFNRQTLEALRQPLEDRVISVARAKETTNYPANFILIATANPCPCGYYGTDQACRCLPHQISHYRQKISGPILDRIDLYADVRSIEHKKLLADNKENSGHQNARAKIKKARLAQAKRYNSHRKLNSDMTNKDIKKLGTISPVGKEIIDVAAKRLHLSPRSYMRTIKVARTIADLDGKATIEPEHITEALQYRDHSYQTQF